MVRVITNLLAPFCLYFAPTILFHIISWRGKSGLHIIRVERDSEVCLYRCPLDVMKRNTVVRRNHSALVKPFQGLTARLHKYYSISQI